MFPIRQLWLRLRSCHSLYPKQPPWRTHKRCFRTLKHHQTYLSRARAGPLQSPWVFYPVCGVLLGMAGAVTYQTYQPFQHIALASIRCSRVAGAAISSAIDYKLIMLETYDSGSNEDKAYSECHTRSAQKVLKALLANGGIFIKLGQHMASLVVLPIEWTTTMRVLQDKCEPTPYENIKDLFLRDMGMAIDEVFDDFDPDPIGVASLAQVHVGYHRPSGKRVAIKLQHPHLAEFCDIDMEMVDVTLGWIKYWFPEFELTWLGEEMRTNLPKEMDFVHEAHNAARAVADFENIKCSLYIPEVIQATERVLIMEYIQGGRVDDLQYLADFNIDRNKVAIELSRIFNQMLFINGWFHADPHPGNILIRPASPQSNSPFNFEIVLLDHGLYFDLDTELRVNYSKLWLSLIEPASPETNANRRKYAQSVGNIGPDLYPVFEAALTGRVPLEGSWDDANDNSFRRASSLIDMVPQTENERDAARSAVISGSGVLVSVFDVLRRIPRRVLMILKLNDLTRSLDHALMTTHSSFRIFLVSAKFCTYAVWQSDQNRLIGSMRDRGLLSISLLWDYFACWWRYQKCSTQLSLLEMFMDTQASLTKCQAWIRGLVTKGFKGAHDAASGLPYN